MCHVVPLDTTIALSAAEFCGKHKLATGSLDIVVSPCSYFVLTFKFGPLRGY
jgi:hypothetical protein